MPARTSADRREAVAVLRACAVVFFGAWLVIGLHAGAPPGAEPAAGDLLPWQRLFRDLDPPLQRNVRAMQEGDAEAERTRTATKAWPDVAALAADGVPPFAPDPIDRAGYAWRLERDGLTINYRGTPARDPKAPELLLLVQEPAPGAIDGAAQASAGAPADETHHVLADGTLLHVTYWFRAPDAASAPALSRVVDRPFAEGWTQVVLGLQSNGGSS